MFGWQARCLRGSKILPPCLRQKAEGSAMDPLSVKATLLSIIAIVTAYILLPSKLAVLVVLIITGQRLFAAWQELLRASN